MLLCPLQTKSTHGEIAWLAGIDGLPKSELEVFWNTTLLAD